MQFDTNVTRRRYLKAAGLLGAGGLAGAASAQGNNFEIIHWWTAGGEKDAISALIEGFEEEYPDVQVQNNPAPGGAGSALDTVIKNRVLNRNPPSTFQIWPGQALHPYVEGDVLNSIGDSVWTQSVREAYRDDVENLAKPQDNYVAVPINIHRLNNLFYNTEVVNEAGVDPTNIDDAQSLLEAMQTVDEQTEATAMAHQTKTAWSTVQLWENVFISQNGVDPYVDLTNQGNVSAHEQQVRDALSMVAEYRNFFPEDAGSLTWDQANSRVINGEAAFIHQGDWAAGQYISTDDFNYEEQWDYVPFPGTSGTYHVVSDSFVFPKNNPTPEITRNWLEYCASVDAQVRFNPPKGSIPPRTDVPTDPFGPFLTQQFSDFKDSERQPASIAHGTAVIPEVKSNVEGAFAGFAGNWNVDRAYNQLRGAFQTS